MPSTLGARLLRVAREGPDRRIVGLARASFVAAAAVFAVLGERGALNLAGGAVIVYAVVPLRLPRAYDFSVVVAAAFLSWGNALDLYSRVIDYDTFVHLLTQFLIAPAGYLVLARLGFVPAPGDVRPARLAQGIVLITFALGLASGTIWELIEWTLDGQMGTTLIKGQTDTHTDLLADGLGALLGGIRLAAWSVDGGERPALAVEASPSNN